MDLLDKQKLVRELEIELRRVGVIKPNKSNPMDIDLDHNEDIILWDNYDEFYIKDTSKFLKGLKAFNLDAENINDFLELHIYNPRTTV